MENTSQTPTPPSQPTNPIKFPQFAMKGWIIALVALIFIGGWFVGGYNSLAQSRLDVEKAWSNVETTYQRRFDLIPNLVETVKGSMQQEQAVFGAIAEARTKYSGATTQGEKAEAAQGYESALGRLLVVMENYPELKSNQNVQNLMTQIEGTENRISVERNRFNDTATGYNKQIAVFPTSLVALLFGFQKFETFNAAAGAETAPKVEFDMNAKK